MLIIKDVKFLQDFQILLTLSNGHRIIYNIAAKLETARFYHISDKVLFQRGYIAEGVIIRWDEVTELSLEEILFEIKLVREKERRI